MERKSETCSRTDLSDAAYDGPDWFPEDGAVVVRFPKEIRSQKRSGEGREREDLDLVEVASRSAMELGCHCPGEPGSGDYFFSGFDFK